MWRKLLLYMLALVLAVGVFVSCGLFFAGQFSTTTEKYSDNLTSRTSFIQDKSKNTLTISR